MHPEKYCNYEKYFSFYHLYCKTSHWNVRTKVGETKNPAYRGQTGLQLRAGPTRLELATSGLTGRRSNQLNYGPKKITIFYPCK